MPVSENEALMDARVPFEDVRETFDLDLPPADAAPNYDTLGGFVVAQLGRFPKTGEAVEAGGAKFVVESCRGRPAHPPSAPHQEDARGGAGIDLGGETRAGR